MLNLQLQHHHLFLTIASDIESNRNIIVRTCIRKQFGKSYMPRFHTIAHHSLPFDPKMLLYQENPLEPQLRQIRLLSLLPGL